MLERSKRDGIFNPVPNVSAVLVINLNPKKLPTPYQTQQQNNH